MAWDNDDIPATPEKIIKLKGIEYINKFRNFGVSLEKSKNCAVFLVMELRTNFDKNFIHNPFDPAKSAKEYNKKIEAFEKLIKAIEAFC